MRPSLLLIAGWAHPAASLQPLAELLGDLFATHTIAADEFDPRAPRPEPTHLLGWSLGGMRALEAAAAQPGQIRGLFLINTTPRFTACADWPHGLSAAELRALGRGLRKDVAVGLAGFLTLSAKPYDCTTTRPACPLATLDAGLRYLGETDLRPQLSGIACPTLVVHARDDAVVPLAAGEQLAGGLRRGRLVVAEGIGHDLPLRSPAIVADAVRTFHADGT